MRIPEFNNNRCYRKICENLSVFINRGIYRFLIKPILITIPLSIVSILVVEKELLKPIFEMFSNKNIPINESIISGSNQVLLVVIICISIVIYNNLEDFILYLGKSNCELIRNDLHLILKSLNYVTVAKCKRFLEATKTSTKEKWSKEKTFTQITQPDQQIALIIKAIHGFFESFCNQKVDFRIGLMIIKNGNPQDWLYFVPEDQSPRTNISILSTPSSSIMRTIQQKRMVVVEDIQKELKKRNKDLRQFVKGSTTQKDEGSILTYPIFCPNTSNIIYVLSIKADKKNYFLNSNSKKYEWILDNYKTRIILEHHLMLMKTNEEV